MTLPDSLYFVALPLAALLSFAVARYGWAHRDVPGAVPLAVLALAIAFWQLGYALELGNTSQPAKLFWAKLEYLGITVVPTAWLAMAVQYSGRGDWLTRRVLRILGVVPVATLMLALTNGPHRLIWTSVDLVRVGDLTVLDLGHGPAFWVHTAYSYTLLALGVVLVAGVVVRSLNIYRRQAIALLAAVLAPWGANLLFSSGTTTIDPTPLAFVLSAVVMGWGFITARLMDLAPTARDAIFNDTRAAVLVLDVRGRLTDYNGAARRLFGPSIESAVGSPTTRLWPDAGGFMSPSEDSTRTALDLERGPRSYDVSNLELLAGTGQVVGSAIVLDDVTEVVEAEQERIRGAEAAARESEVRRSRRRLVENSEALRREVAEILHSSVQSKLVVLRHRLDQVAQKVRKEGGEDDDLVELRGLLQALVEDEIDAVGARLYPTILRLGLVPAIKSLCDRFNTVVPVNMSLDEGLVARERANRKLLPESTRVAAFRIVENALTNALKHADPETVSVAVGLDSEGALRLSVEDDGKGFDYETASQDRGLGTMQDYADVAGGRCVVRSSRGKGTEVLVTLPLDAAARDD